MAKKKKNNVNTNELAQEGKNQETQVKSKSNKTKNKKHQKKKKYYAIKEGNGVADIILRDWDECKKYVLGYPSVYKSFLKEEEALEYLKTVNADKVKEQTKWCRENKEKIKEKKAKQKVEYKITIENGILNEFKAKCKKIGLSDKTIVVALIKDWLNEDNETEEDDE